MNQNPSAHAAKGIAVRLLPPPAYRVLAHQSTAATRIALLLLVAGLAWWFGQCTQLGLAFYARVLPFYDSLSYQAAFTHAARLNHDLGALRAVAQVWSEPHNNVVLYKLFAAATAGVLPGGKLGLYIYLFSTHLAAIAAIVVATTTAHRSLVAGLVALAAFLATWPFGQALNGVLDQRMDLSSASLYTAVVALGFHWSRAPSLSRAAVTGLVVSFTLLHRPVMAPAAVTMLGLWSVRACLRHRDLSARTWLTHASALVLPILVLAAPWFITHAKALHHYYFVANVDVGSAQSWSDALSYNFSRFWLATGPRPTAIAVVGLAIIAWWRGVDWLDAGIVALGILVPLGLLIVSRSTGNALVCQLPLGMPALLLAATAPTTRPTSVLRSSTLGLIAALLLLHHVGTRNLSALHHQVSILPPHTRSEAVSVLRAIETRLPGGRVAGFQVAPADIMGLSHLAKDEEINVVAGTIAFHPLHFGLTTESSATLESDEVQASVARIVDRVAANDDCLLLPAAESDPMLQPVPYSHQLIPLIRARVVDDPRFRAQPRIGQIKGITFDLFLTGDAGS